MLLEKIGARQGTKIDLDYQHLEKVCKFIENRLFFFKLKFFFTENRSS